MAISEIQISRFQPSSPLTKLCDSPKRAPSESHTSCRSCVPFWRGSSGVHVPIYVLMRA